MNKRAILKVEFAVQKNIKPEAEGRLKCFNEYLAHVNDVILPILKETGMSYNLTQIVTMTADPRLIPGIHEEVKALDCPDANMLRYTGRRMVLHEVAFLAVYGKNRNDREDAQRQLSRKAMKNLFSA